MVCDTDGPPTYEHTTAGLKIPIVLQQDCRQRQANPRSWRPESGLDNDEGEAQLSTPVLTFRQNDTTPTTQGLRSWTNVGLWLGADHNSNTTRRGLRMY